MSVFALSLPDSLLSHVRLQIDAFFRDQSGAEDAARRQRIAKQIGLDKLPVQEVKHQEDVSHAA
jgi:hypothetical protein